MIDRPTKCPRCQLPDLARHPALQFKDEVQVCPNSWHKGPMRMAEFISRAYGPLYTWNMAKGLTVTNMFKPLMTPRARGAAKRQRAAAEALAALIIEANDRGLNNG